MASKQAATLHDWQRSFCLRMVVGRGSPDKPGRMLALEAGGHTDGVALKLSEDTVNEELLLVWIRETRVIPAEMGTGDIQGWRTDTRIGVRSRHHTRPVRARFLGDDRCTVYRVCPRQFRHQRRIPTQASCLA
ncbi:gamma-glutamylcyclotransferase [Paraburkholderia caribensis]|uniref:gamma-glutamylcyclotransferase n=1 Tax=Paraburkholderia caribensis TaxID=75105 RepID=UPI00286A2C2F|nr:gamma-glutamylcyclotransferase [Paraburkholderia caribensis]